MSCLLVLTNRGQKCPWGCVDARLGHALIEGTCLTAALASNYMFDGAKAELQKSISLAPMFQINHAFSLGGQSPGAPGPSPGNYNFAAVVVNDDVLRPLDQVCFIGYLHVSSTI